MKLPRLFGFVLLAVLALSSSPAFSQPLGIADGGQPGDRMIQDYLTRETRRIQPGFVEDISSRKTWDERREQYRQEYLYMLGLAPLPEKTPLHATITGTLDGDGYSIDLLHYQSRPGLYVTANLYRPRPAKTERLPGVLYVCGHSGRGRNGNKTAFQSHGLWFARHGYVCLVVDTLQLGEIAATHHGTYNQGRWWWLSRGYTSAGVECWNGVRGLDYLVSRGDVDPDRLAVTGISGGGAATFWVATADERVRVAVPISGMADLLSYVPNRVINGHCDCMFLHNTFAWPWTRIAGLVAPRPMLFVNSDHDPIFPMDANDRIANRLERLYSLYGAGDQFDALVSVGGHDYRQDIRQATFRFLNTYLKNDPRLVTDTEVDLVTGSGAATVHPIDPVKLRVFSTDLPADQLNTTIDQHFVPLAQPQPPRDGEFESWRKGLLDELRRVTFRYFPERIRPARQLVDSDEHVVRVESENGIEFRLRFPAEKSSGKRVLLAVVSQDEADSDPAKPPAWIADLAADDEEVVICEPRGVGETQWTRRNPPNYVERSHVLLGRTVDTGRVWDVVAAARYVRRNSRLANPIVPVRVAGRGPNAILAAYAAVFEPEINAVAAVEPPASHSDSKAPPFLNILRVCDVPEMFGLVAPRPFTVVNGPRDAWQATRRCYEAAGAANRFTHEKE